MGAFNKMTRYDRQMNVLPDASRSQQKLAAARILVVGAGGLASPVLQYLVGAGVGHIRLVDGDVVSLSNMHRQTIYRDDDIGRPKVERAASHMAALNPDCQITPVPAYLTPDKIAEQAAGVNLILDCADSFAVSYSLSDYCRGRLPLVSASVVGCSAIVAGFAAQRHHCVPFSRICHAVLGVVPMTGCLGQWLALLAGYRHKWRWPF